MLQKPGALVFFLFFTGALHSADVKIVTGVHWFVHDFNGQTYLVIPVEVQNSGYAQFNFYTKYFTATIDSFQYRAYAGNVTDAQMPDDVTLKNGQKIRGFIAFRVPSERSDFALSYELPASDLARAEANPELKRTLVYSQNVEWRPGPPAKITIDYTHVATREYTTKQGQTLTSIAESELKDKTRAKEILELNIQNIAKLKAMPENKGLEATNLKNLGVDKPFGANARKLLLPAK